MITDDHFHLESLEQFTSELTSAGFRENTDSDPSRWTGDIHPAFEPLTDAKTMDILIRPGWPFRPPDVIVQGLNTNHSMSSGLVCMWREGDPSLEWTTLDGLNARIEKWCENATNGWDDDLLDQDALLNFWPKDALVATFDLGTLSIHERGWGEFHGIVNADPFRLHIEPRHPSAAGSQLKGLWFHVGALAAPPPRHLAEVPAHLSRGQRRGLQRALTERRRPDPLVVSGGVDLILFCWERRGRLDLLVMVCKGVEDKVEAIAVQPGPQDEESLILRAGPDSGMLRTRKATLFGAGALGGHTATLLAESGLGSLTLVDPDVLLPGNIVRHVAGHGQVGSAKVKAVEAIIADHAPWTEVACFQEGPGMPRAIRERIEDADVVIDATGNEVLLGSLAIVAEEMNKPLVSGALYRGGFIGRVQRQALPADTPIHLREDSSRYPVIPAGLESEDFASPQLGCSAPINNAPPSAVSACASLIAQATIDALTGRFDFADEVIDVYQPIPDPPYDRVGRICRGSLKYQRIASNLPAAEIREPADRHDQAECRLDENTEDLEGSYVSDLQRNWRQTVNKAIDA